MRKVSVIMPVYLGQYVNCAKDRVEKFERAVNSALSSDYKNIELVIVGDCCKETDETIQKIKSKLSKEDSNKIVFYNFEQKQPIFSGVLRSAGLDLCSGEIIMYLDSDDLYGDKHISTVVSQFESNNLDWCYYNDLIRTETGLTIRDVDLEHGKAGTSCIAHIKKDCPNWTGCDGYGHDWTFIQRLIDWSDNYDKIYGCSYIVNHIPEMTDF